jgi:hypothetical protein
MTTQCRKRRILINLDHASVRLKLAKSIGIAILRENWLCFIIDKTQPIFSYPFKKIRLRRGGRVVEGARLESV